MSTDGRTERVAPIRGLIEQAEPGIREETNWVKPTNPAGVPTFSLDGLICTVETYRDKIEVTFGKGASLPDPGGLFNASLDAGTDARSTFPRVTRSTRMRSSRSTAADAHRTIR